MKISSLEEKIRQTAIVLAKPNKQISHMIGGVFVGAQIIGEAEDGQSAVRNTVERYSENAMIPPIFVSDFENGCGGMIRGLTALPYLMNLGAANSKQLAYDYGKATAMEALSAGVRWSFSPVSDLNVNFRNPTVNVRGISDDENIALPLLQSLIKGMQENGLAACAKHFPGDGMDWRDQHLVTTCNSLTLEEWQKKHGKIFEGLIQAGVYSIMAGHITLPAYQTNKLPATLSHQLLTKLLKQGMCFDGVVVSDAMDMGGFLGWYDKDRAAVECFKAGCDMVLWPGENYVQNMVEAVENNYIPKKQLEDSVDRILEMKSKLGLFDQDYKKFQPIAREHECFAKTVQQQVAEQSVTLIKDEDNILPLSKKQKLKILIIPVTHYQPALHEAKHLKQELEAKGVTVSYFEEKISMERLIEESGRHDYVIYALFTRSLRPIGPIDFHSTEAFKIHDAPLVPKHKMIVVSFGSPYFEKQYFERMHVYINAYSMLDSSVTAFVKALYGEIPFGSFSPVRLNGEVF